MTIQALSTAQNAISTLADDFSGLINANPVASIAGAAGVGAVAGVATAAAVGAVKKRKRSKSRTTRKRNSVRSKRSRKRKTPRTAGKRKDRSHKRIRYTKNGQPYVILSSGKARFISNKSAKSSRKRKGGRY